MNLEQLFNAYLAYLWGAWQYDMGVYSQWWMYVLLFIPFTFYSMFFIIKWYILLAPITITLSVVSALLEGIKMPKIIIFGKNYKKEDLEKEKRRIASEELNERISKIGK